MGKTFPLLLHPASCAVMGPEISALKGKVAEDRPWTGRLLPIGPFSGWAACVREDHGLGGLDGFCLLFFWAGGQGCGAQGPVDP